MSNSSTQQSGTGTKHTAGAYDVRTVISALIGVFGIVLVVMGLINNSGEEIEKAGGVNANLWTGIGMVVFAVLVALWTWLRPVTVDPSTIEHADDVTRANH
ncbi:hypothetical protein [Modestobacter sp. NPDC049651]|uniref:hypothetical protein n=1 Tax=unclassified Modestobacter TaxID=2643866 RepID=UPI0033CBB2AC